jgi:hypothetical protein
MPDHSGIRLPVIKRRFVPQSRTTGAAAIRRTLGGPPIRPA